MCVLRTVGDAGPYNAIREHPYENQPKVWSFLFTVGKPEARMVKCGANERRWRALGRAIPLCSPILRANMQTSLVTRSIKRKDHTKASFS